MVTSDSAIRLHQYGRASAVARLRDAMEDAIVTPNLSEAERELAMIAAARSDPRAFAPLYEAYVDLVWRYALSRIGNRERAADATSLTFQRALTALPRYEPRLDGEITTFRSWLMTIARNVVIDDVRRHRPTSSLDDTASQPWLVDRQRGPEALAVASDEARRVDAALKQLPEAQRQIVQLRLAGLKGSEIAAILGKSESAIKTAHFRAYARLKTLLAEPAGDEEIAR